MATDPASLFTIEGTVFGPGGTKRPDVRLAAVGAGLPGRLDTMGLGSDGYGDGRMWSSSVRSRFPEAWAAFRQPADGQPHRAELSLGAEHYPHPLSGSTLRVSEVFVVPIAGGVATGTLVSVAPPNGSVESSGLIADPGLSGVLVAGPITVSTPPAATSDAVGSWVVGIEAQDVSEPTTLDDLILVVRYTEGG